MEKEYFGVSLTTIVALAVWVLYLLFALVLNFSDALPFALFTAFCMTVYVLMHYNPVDIPPMPKIVDRVILGVLAGLALCLVLWEIVAAPNGGARMCKVQSLIGFFALVGMSALISQNRSHIPWRLVAAGLLCQFYMGVFVFRSSQGYHMFKAMGDGVDKFLAITDEGTAFVLGNGNDEDATWKHHFFAFAVLPKLIFFSAVCSCLFYLGVLQAAVQFLAVVLKAILGSSMTESVNAAGNIFLDQTSAPLLVRPILPFATPSEIHCIMTGGFATVAGSVLAAYIGMGVNPVQLIGASVMSAPAALTISKMMCPDGVTVQRTTKEKVDDDDDKDAEEGATSNNGYSKGIVDIDRPGDDEHSDAESSEDTPPEFHFPPPEERNIIEAAANGASIGISLVANIAAMLIAFLSLIKAINLALGKIGDLVEIHDLTFQLICGYVFMPVAWLLGAPGEDCRSVAQLIGTKIFVNEFVAYADLSELLKESPRGITERGELIATYALCGFSNIGSIGIQLGALSAICPEKKYVFTALVVSAMIAGNTCCFLTATVAGMLQ